MTLYAAKQIPVEAIQFQYTEEGINALRLFAGDAVGAITEEKYSDRVERKAHVTGALDPTTMKQQRVMSEGSWLVKIPDCDQQVFLIFDDESFRSTYEEID